jgi:creatinine amidohydrolase
MGTTTARRHWQDLAWTDFAALPADAVAVLPVAAIEQHGPHLPLSVDATINAGILARALDLVPPDRCVLALPMQSVGLSVEHIRFPGTLTLSAETLIAVLTEIGRSVRRAGVRRLVFLNSHGGQPPRGDGLFAVNCHWGRLGLPASVTLDPVERRHGFHGGLVETSLMLHLRPDLVRMEHARDFRSAWIEQEERFSVLTPEGGVGFGWETQDLHPAGALGNAGAATAVAGSAILEHAAARLVQLWDEVRRLDVASWMREGPTASRMREGPAA